MKPLLIFLALTSGALSLVAQQASPLPSSAPSSAMNIVFVGDSITYGAWLDNEGVDKRLAQAPPMNCAHELEKRLPNTQIFTSNQGYCGYGTGAFLPPASEAFIAVKSAAEKLNAAHNGQLIFSIMLGTNDSANTNHVSAESYHDNLKKTIGQLLSDFPDCKVVINHPIWYSPNTHNRWDYEGASAADRLKSYSPQIDSLVTEYGTSHPNRVYGGDPFAYQYFAAYYKSEIVREPGKNGDFYLHPNAIGAASLGKFWAAALCAVLRP